MLQKQREPSQSKKREYLSDQTYRYSPETTSINHNSGVVATMFFMKTYIIYRLTLFAFMAAAFDIFVSDVATLLADMSMVAWVDPIVRLGTAGGFGALVWYMVAVYVPRIEQRHREERELIYKIVQELRDEIRKLNRD